MPRTTATVRWRLEARQDRELQHPTTDVGRVTFRDSNGVHEARVSTDGCFWRVVEVEAKTGLTPAAARKLAKLILKAATLAEREARRLGWDAEQFDEVAP